MRNRVVLAGLVISVTLTAAEAQAQRQYRRPTCELSRGHFLVSQAETYLRGASETNKDEERTQLLGDARRTLFEAFERGETENPSVWYFLGRVYFMLNDAAGVDSAFSQAARLAPECAEDIEYYRDALWVPLINGAVDTLRAGDFEAAKDMLRRANELKDNDNVGFYYLARIFANEAEVDSAQHYFKRVAQMDADTARMANKLDAISSIATLHYSLEEWDSAAVWYERLREVKPNDPEAMVNLAHAYAQTGDVARATALYEQVFANAATMSASDLFSAGESLYRAERYALAARAYELGLEKNPYAGTVIFDLVTAYRAIAQGQAPAAERRAASTAMLAAARRLVQADPLNSEGIRMLAAAHQIAGRADSTDIVLARLEQLAVEMDVFQAEPIEGGYVVQGLLRNRRNQQINAPRITFEFMDASGNVVTTATTGGMALAARADTTFSLTGQGNIVGYRYKVGS
jgi:tetratricopeptide (TPR) repeat protein